MTLDDDVDSMILAKLIQRGRRDSCPTFRSPGPTKSTRMRSPMLAPANPPTTLFGPLLETAPDAVELLIEPFSRLPAAKPPSTALAPPLTLPNALEFVICAVVAAGESARGAVVADRDVPERRNWSSIVGAVVVPAKPPALLLLETLPKAKLPVIEPLLLPANSPASPSLARWMPSRSHCRTRTSHDRAGVVADQAADTEPAAAHVASGEGVLIVPVFR